MDKRFPPKNLRESVYAAAAFFDVFDRPLMRREFADYIFGGGVSVEEIEEFLRKDVRLDSRDDYYFLRGREEVLQVREMRRGISDLYWKRVHRYVPKLQMVPFIRAVAVCNTLAFDHCTSDSDIDLFIITRKNRIFTARVLSSIFFHLLGVRRHGDKVAGRFCLSFYVSEDAMNLEEMQKETDAYLFYWMRSLQFVYRADRSVFSSFYKKNSWFTAHVSRGMGEMSASKKRFFYRFIGSAGEFFLSGFFGNWIEKLLERRHMKRFKMRQKKFGPHSDVVVNKAMLKFHNIDRRHHYNQQFFERLRRLL